MGPNVFYMTSRRLALRRSLLCTVCFAVCLVLALWTNESLRKRTFLDYGLRPQVRLQLQANEL